METSIKENLENITKKLGSTKLVVVSKTRTIQELEEVYGLNFKCMAENRVQYLLDRYEQLPKDIEWHLIGHLQTNKVKFIAPFVQMIQSVDSAHLLEEINKQAIKNNRVIDILLQIYIAKEETKFGMDEQEALEILNNNFEAQYAGVRIRGLMGMASFTENQTQVRSEFKHLKNIYDKLNSTLNNRNINYFDTLSMGMSGDYEMAIEEGSTLVRIGSAVFAVDKE